MMADKPIIFSAPMVNALLAGRKTQTRRLMPHQETLKVAYSPIVSGIRIFNYAGEEEISRPPYAPGDRLWVREAFIGPYAYEVNEYPPRDWGNKPIWFPADGPVPDKFTGQFWHRARPSIHMPRWASRLTLTVTDVRVHRLQEISEADAVAEGIEQARSGRFYDPTVSRGTAAHLGGMHHGARSAYEALWNSLHGPHAWDANPWVAAYSFAVQHGNIDTQGDPQ